MATGAALRRRNCVCGAALRRWCGGRRDAASAGGRNRRAAVRAGQLRCGARQRTGRACHARASVGGRTPSPPDRGGAGRHAGALHGARWSGAARLGWGGGARRRARRSSGRADLRRDAPGAPDVCARKPAPAAAGSVSAGRPGHRRVLGRAPSRGNADGRAGTEGGLAPGDLPVARGATERAALGWSGE